jgi:hypothetical protein
MIGVREGKEVAKRIEVVEHSGQLETVVIMPRRATRGFDTVFASVNGKDTILRVSIHGLICAIVYDVLSQSLAFLLCVEAHSITISFGGLL